MCDREGYRMRNFLRQQRDLDVMNLTDVPFLILARP
jgi:hypothetical protein